FFVAAEVVAMTVLHRERPGFLKEFLLSLVGAALLFLPWMPTFIVHLTSVNAGFWLSAPTPSGVWFAFCSLVVSPLFMRKLGYLFGSTFHALAIASVRRPKDIALVPLLLVPPVRALL